MEFTQYSSIENSYREKYVNQIINDGYAYDGFVVLSKLDGANFSYLCNGKQVMQASRNNIVGTDFFNCGAVVNKYHDRILNLFKLIERDYDVTQIQLYGELIGDGINNRVRYCKGREFFAFDLYLTTAKDSFFMDHYLFLEYLNKADLPIVPQHTRGFFKECLDYCNNNLTFKSKIPTLLNNEYKDLETNNEEGYVIKPVKECKLTHGGGRVILKVKSPDFKEEASGKGVKIPVTLTEEEATVLNELSSFITESRVYSVVSKMGILNDKMFGGVLKAYTKDLLEEYAKTGKSIDLTKATQKELNKMITDCIKNIWLKLLDQ